MLCPEVWNFEPPPFSTTTEFCQSEEDILKKIKHQYFNHHVSVMIPNTLQIPNALVDTLIEDTQFYRINKVNASELLKRNFSDLFVKKGHVTAISISEISDQNSLAITPCGKLILSLSQTTFQQLGIQHSFTDNSKRFMKKYFVTLDINSETNEGRKKCEEAYKKLSLNCNLCFDIVLAWEPDEANICPSSIAYYFSELGHIVKSCDILYTKKLKYNVTIPLYENESDVSEVIEWLGAFNLDCDISEENYISTFKWPEKSETIGQVMLLTFSGLLTQNRIKKIISELIKYVKIKSLEFWIGLSVQSFQNNIISVRNKNFYFSEGDESFTVIFKYNYPFTFYIFKDKKR